MAKNSGSAYEDLTEIIFRKLSKKSPFSTVQRNVTLETPHGPRQIDILLTVESMGLVLRTIVECRDHKRKVDVMYLDGIVSKMKDVQAHKAVVVSSSGFTSGAKSKGKEYDIELCIAQEALNNSWNIDVEIPILVFEATPLRIELNSDFPTELETEFEHYRKELLINDRNIYDIIREKWNSGELILESEDSVTRILKEELPPPHFIKDRTGRQIELATMQIGLEYSITAYFGNLKEIENTQLLKNLSKNKQTVFFDSEPIKNYKSMFRRLASNEKLQFETLSLVVKTGLQIGAIGATRISLIKN